MSTACSQLFVTTGEPAGIGPDLLIQYVQQAPADKLVVVASQALLKQRADKLGLPITLLPFNDKTPQPQSDQIASLRVIDVPLIAPVACGQLDTANASYVLDSLRQAVALCQQHPDSALVTGPLHKGIINEAGTPFTGHTEFLAELTQTEQVVMMLACPGLRVALATTHLPLSEVSRAITPARLTAIIEILHHDLQSRFGIGSPHILVCGLNPHAGEDGHLGREEIEIIEPVLTTLRQQGMQLTGPLPADTLFIPKYLDTADAVLAMYHDQGLPVLKHMGFGKAVNITLGLPFIRTSVDHGTALELAGTGKAEIGSLRAAIETAEQLIHTHSLSMASVQSHETLS